MANKVTTIRVDDKLDFLYDSSMIPKNQLVQCAINMLYLQVVDNSSAVDVYKLVDFVKTYAE